MQHIASPVVSFWSNGALNEYGEVHCVQEHACTPRVEASTSITVKSTIGNSLAGHKKTLLDKTLQSSCCDMPGKLTRHVQHAQCFARCWTGKIYCKDQTQHRHGRTHATDPAQAWKAHAPDIGMYDT